MQIKRLARVSEAYGNLPISFEANQGQFDSRVKFVSRGNGCTMFLTANEAVFQLRVATPADKSLSNAIETVATPDSQLATLKMKLVGANDAPVAQGVSELPGKVNYFAGSDSKRWRTGVATYAKALFKQVYPGVDLVYYGNHRELEYDLKVAPGANLGAVRLAFEGARRIRIDKRGDLVLSTLAGEIRQRKPVAYQETNGARKEISARFVMKSARQVGFEVARYDASKPLVIDPALSYSTYLGGSEEDTGNGIAVDASGNAYITGFTVSFNFPTTVPLQPVAGDFIDAFITKLNPTGTALIYSTYLGGDNQDFGNGIAVDPAGNAYVTGETFSSDFPLMNPIQSTNFGAGEAFVTKLNSTGSALIYSTLLGGNRVDIGQSIAADAAGNTYVTGRTNSPGFPTANALQPSFGGVIDVFVSKLNPTGTAFVYSTFIGGVGSESIASIAADSNGNAYVAGSTVSPDFPTANALQPVFKGKTIFKTTDGASNWAHINNGLSPHFSVTALAVDPLTTSTVYAGTSLGTLFKTTNGGNNWNPVNVGLPTTSVIINAIAIDRVNPARIFLATSAGLFRTTDGGLNWSRHPDFFNVFSAAIDPVNPSNVYVGFRDNIGKSTNGGDSWITIPVRPEDSFQSSGIVSSIAIDPTTPSTLYVGGSLWVYKSTDGGLHWSVKTNGLFGQQVLAVAINPSNTSTVYAGTTFSLFKSIDGGEHWNLSNSGLASPFRTVAIDPLTPSTLYVGTADKGIYKSTNGGGSWTAMSNGLQNSFVFALAIDPVNTAKIYAGNLAVNDGFVLKLNPNASMLIYSTYLGGDNADFCSDIAVDASGNVYVTGQTNSIDFPTVNPLQAHHNNNTDSFISKLNAGGTALVYSTYLGGSGNDTASSIAVDSNGNAYVIGSTNSTDFPVFAALQSSLSDVFGDAFVTKLNATGTAFDYSTYLGGGSGDPLNFNEDIGNAIAVDASGNAYVTGETFSSTFPTTPGAFQITRNSEQAEAFVSKISTFDICLQDDVNGNLLEFNSTTGEYRFSNCRKKFTLSGRGTVSTKFCKIELKANAPGHSITASANTCIHNGSATVQVSAQRQTYTVNDKNTTNNTCSCP